MIRYFVSAIIAALALFSMLFGLSKAIGPGSPGELLIIGQLDLLDSPQSEDSSDKP